MTKNPPQKFKVPTVTQVHNGKRVAKRVRRKPNAGNAALLPKYLEIPVQVMNGDLRIVLRTEYIGPHLEGPAGFYIEETPKAFSKFTTEGYDPVLAAFPENFKGQLVKINIFFRESKNLRSTKPGIKDSESYEMRPLKVHHTGLRDEAKQTTNIFFRKRR